MPYFMSFSNHRKAHSNQTPEPEQECVSGWRQPGRSLTLSLERRSLTGLKPHLVVSGWEISPAGLVAGPPKAGWKPALRQWASEDKVKLRPPVFGDVLDACVLVHCKFIIVNKPLRPFS